MTDKLPFRVTTVCQSASSQTIAAKGKQIQIKILVKNWNYTGRPFGQFQSLIELQNYTMQISVNNAVFIFSPVCDTLSSNDLLPYPTNGYNFVIDNPDSSELSLNFNVQLICFDISGNQLDATPYLPALSIQVIEIG